MTDEWQDDTAKDGTAVSESRRPAAPEPTAAERRAQALRDNLRRRKVQARARKAGPGGESPPGR